MKKYLFLLLFSIVACQKESKLIWKDVSYKNSSSIVLEAGIQTEAHFIVPTFEPSGELGDLMNEYFLNESAEILGFEISKDATFDTLGNHFVSSYEKIHKALPTDVTPWEAKFQGRVLDLNKIYHTVLEYYVFSGGTSVEEGIRSAFFDKSSQKRIEVSELFLNYKGFEQMVEKKFVEQFGNYTSEEFFFEKNQFKVSKNIYIKNDAFVVSYASGEIAPMYKGTFDVKIPKQQIQSLINPIYF